jgi:putative tryptophan/tyrosine transport system substrate-binding protein
LLGGAAVSPHSARAQQREKLATIWLMVSSTAADMSHLTAAFVRRLRELGWIEGRTVAIEYRWGEGRTERFAEIAGEFVRLKVDVILTHNTPPTLAAKQATSVSGQASDTTGKRIELLREIVPGLRRLAILADVGNPFTPCRNPRGVDWTDVNDPSATLAVHCGNGFDARFEPYQSTRLSRYNAGP